MNRKLSIILIILLTFVAFIVIYIFKTYTLSTNKQAMILKVAKMYGEANPTVVEIKNDKEESTKKLMYFILLKGKFKNGSQSANRLRFSVMGDFKHAWAFTGYDMDKNEIIWAELNIDVFN